MTEFEIFIKILETSAKRNGKDKSLTVGHLLNIARMAQKEHQRIEDDDSKTISSHEDNYWDTVARNCGDN